MNNINKTLLIGSSISFFPMIYLGIAYNKLSCDDKVKLKMKYANMIMLLPIIYTLVYLILQIILSQYMKNNRTKYFIMGIIAGLIFSFIGNYLLNIPKTMFKMKETWQVYLEAPILYGIIFATYVFYLENNI